uniref:Uncharacterized protein n=1 Tax=Arcella intermedia TaxID=1963864 RepID=A0A6B2LHG5_9EUKA
MFMGLPPGPRCVAMKVPLNVFKGLTPLVLGILMVLVGNFEMGACVYVALHGSYGIMWVLKGLLFPDKKWEEKVTIPSIILISLALIMYWRTGWVVITTKPYISPIRAGLAVFLHTMGLVMMIASDTQKYFTLKYKPGLITEGWFSRSRNTNYLGEVFLYCSYCIMAQDMVSWLFCTTIWCTYFLKNILDKENSLKKKKGWQEYVSKSNMFLPKIF